VPGRRSREVVQLCAMALVVAVAAACLGLARGGDRATGWQLAARYTARVAFPLFLAIFVAGPWRRLAPGPVPRWLVARRRGLGLAFVGMFTVHLAALASYALVRGQAPGVATLVVGGGAFAALSALALTSRDAAVRRLGARRWRRLHAFGLYYLWAIFTLTYAGRLARAPGFYVGFALVCVAALALRIAGRRRRERRSLAVAA
jgi:sulfoxide reductase heme-binding subunit YedZ